MKRLNLFALGLLAFLLAVPQGAHAAGFTFLSTVGDQTFYVGTPASVTLPQVDPNSDDSISPCHHRDTTYSISPALPPGLSFAGGQGSNSSTTLILSGTPTQATAQTEYTYTGQENNCYVTATATFNITVEAAKVSLSKSSVGLTEGGDTATYNVKLGSAPTADVTVTVTSGDSDAVTVTPSSLTFNTTDYSTNQTVTVTPVNDEDGADETVTVTHSASGGGFDGESSALTATVTDDDKGITITPSSLSVFEGGSSKTYSMALAAQPSGNVTVSPSSNPTIDTRSTTAPSTLTFTKNNWNVYQTLTVRPLNDLDNFNHSSSRTYKAFGGGYGSGTVTGAITISVKESFLCSDQSTDDLKADCAVLETLYDDAGGANWTNKTNWKDSDTLDRWHGITVSGGRVSEIELYENQLTGTIPSDIANLSGLTLLDLGANSLSGTIPSGLSSLSKLIFLFLDGNSLGGTMDSIGLDSMDRLVWVHLHNNSISGTIPELSGGQDLNLKTIKLDNNKLSGTLDNLADSTSARNLQDLFLNNNDISGTIPDLSGLPSLRVIHLADNSISGTMAELGKLAQRPYARLFSLDLGNNNLSGSLPDLGFLAPGRRGLNFLSLYGNSLSGDLPDLSSYTNLVGIKLANNSFSGEIGGLGGSSGDLSVFGKLYVLDVSGNSLTGEIPVLSKLPGRLEYLQLSDNDLTGSVPDLSGFTKLRALGLWGNPDLTLTGITLPSGVNRSVIDWAALWALHYKNGGYGWINRSNWLGLDPLGQWHGVTTDSNGQVTVLNLRNNNMSGNISGSIAALEKLVTLNLSCNSALNGELPLGLKDISTLTTVNICSTGMTVPTDSDFTTWKNSITFTDGSVCACPQAVSQQSSPPPVEEEEAEEENEEQGGSGQGGGDGENEVKEEEEPVVPADGDTEAGGCSLVSGEEPPGAGPGLLLFAAALLATSRLRRRGSGKIHGGRAAAGRGVVNLPLQK